MLAKRLAPAACQRVAALGSSLLGTPTPSRPGPTPPLTPHGRVGPLTAFATGTAIVNFNKGLIHGDAHLTSGFRMHRRTASSPAFLHTVVVACCVQSALRGISHSRVLMSPDPLPTAAKAASSTLNDAAAAPAEGVTSTDAVGTRKMWTTPLEAATRLVDPSAAHPATGATSVTPSELDASKSASSDAANSPGGVPREQWREHWDLESKRPYYHNLVTNELSWNRPVGFDSRFAFYYSRIHQEYHLGQRTEEHLANPPDGVERIVRVEKPAATTPVVTPSADGVASAAAPAATTPSHMGPIDAEGATNKKRTLKDQIKDFGVAGFLLYLIIHFASLGVVFLIMYNGVDLSGIARSIGFDVQPSNGGSAAAILVVSIAVNKVFNPVQLVLTIFLAPRFVPVIRRVIVKIYSYNK